MHKISNSKGYMSNVPPSPAPDTHTHTHPGMHTHKCTHRCVLTHPEQTGAPSVSFGNDFTKRELLCKVSKLVE